MPKLSDFKPGDAVVFIPNHAGDQGRAHVDCERGRVSSVNDHYVFVRFNQHVEKFGWEGATSQACKVENLEKE